EMLQDVGTAIEIAGIATAQPEITGAGTALWTAGSVLEGTLKASIGELTKQEVGYEVGKGFVFGKLSKGGLKAVESKNLSKEANNVWQGIVKGWEMLSDWAWELGTGGDNDKNK